MAVSDLVNFKRGTSSDLQKIIDAQKGIDGCFYLTIDDDTESSRLYVGRSNGDVVPVNQGIITVDSVTDLGQLVHDHKIHSGDFAYCKDKNILAVYSGPGSMSGTGWVQLNQDKYINQLQQNVNVTGNVATIDVKAWYNGLYSSNGDNGDLHTQFKITGTEGINVSSTSDVNGDTLTIQGDKYAISSASSANNQTTISLNSDKNTGINGSSNHGRITLIGGTNVGVADDGSGNVTLTAKDHSLQGLAISAENEGFKITATKSSEDNDVVSNVINPEVKYGYSAAQDATTATARFEKNVLTIDTYTRAEIDTLKKNINSMTYKGTLGFAGQTGSAGTLGTMGSVQVGDTFKVVGPTHPDYATLPAVNGTTGSDITLKAGDLLIVTGAKNPSTNLPYNTEDAVTGNVTSTPIVFDVIPAGDDVDTQYIVNMDGNSSHGITLTSTSQGESIGGIALANDEWITLNDSQEVTSNNGVQYAKKTVAVGHANITHTDTTNQGVDNEGGATITSTFISDVVVDNKGHITGIVRQPVNIKSESTELNGYSKSGSYDGQNNTVNIQSTIQTVDAAGDYSAQLSGVDFASSNLALNVSNVNTHTYTWTNPENNQVTTVQKTTPVVSVNFLWGNFADDVPSSGN